MLQSNEKPKARKSLLDLILESPVTPPRLQFHSPHAPSQLPQPLQPQACAQELRTPTYEASLLPQKLRTIPSQ